MNQSKPMMEVNRSDNIERNPNNRMNKTVRVLNVPKEQPDNIKCSLCDTVIKLKRNLARHMRDVHGQNKDSDESEVDLNQLFNCDYCDKRFGSHYHLDRHLKSSNCLNNLLLECKNCKRKFVSELKLANHVKKNCSKKYLCTFCFCYFATKKLFTEHMGCHGDVVHEA